MCDRERDDRCVCDAEIDRLADRVSSLDLPEVAPLVASLSSMLKNLVHIGLGYLSLDRQAGTLSGGEYNQ